MLISTLSKHCFVEGLDNVLQEVLSTDSTKKFRIFDVQAPFFIFKWLLQKRSCSLSPLFYLGFLKLNCFLTSENVLTCYSIIKTVRFQKKFYLDLVHRQQKHFQGFLLFHSFFVTFSPIQLSS